MVLGLEQVGRCWWPMLSRTFCHHQHFSQQVIFRLDMLQCRQSTVVGQKTSWTESISLTWCTNNFNFFITVVQLALSDLYMEWSLSYICWDHTQLRHCYFIIWQELGYLNGQTRTPKVWTKSVNWILSENIREKTQRLQTKASWKSYWNVQQSKAQISF